MGDPGPVPVAGEELLQLPGVAPPGGEVDTDLRAVLVLRVDDVVVQVPPHHLRHPLEI